MYFFHFTVAVVEILFLIFLFQRYFVGNRKDKLAQFSFLMVIPPILGEALLDMKDLLESAGTASAGDGTGTATLVIGFLAAFISGCAACKWMISIVRKGKLIWFGIYCAVAGILTLIFL